MSTSLLLVLLQWFPFLIGTVRTFDYVSYVDDCPVFPFLIGTVRTILSSIFLLVSISFPFLIGTVRTYKTYYKRTRILCLFPFLIGTVRTRKTLLSLHSTLVVSIPHRYGKNYIFYDLWDDYFKVSIPHRYGKNSKCDLLWTSQWNFVSIPHRYGKNKQLYYNNF